MARYLGPKCKLSRREGTDLFLKSGVKPLESKCKLEVPPGGIKGERRARVSGYGLQLREKQKVKRIYGVLERQFRLYFAEADRQKGITGHNLLVALERRLDNVVFSLGFAASRAQARQVVRHGHVLVDGKKASIPSLQVRAGQTVAIKESSRNNLLIRASVETARGRGVPGWLELDAENCTGKVVTLPTREDIKMPVQEQLIVELYSR